MLLINEIDIKPRSSLRDIIDFGLFEGLPPFISFTSHIMLPNHHAWEKSTFSILIVPITSNLRNTCKINTYCSDSSKMMIIIYFHVMKIYVKLFHFPKDDKNDPNRIVNLLPISMTGAIKVSTRWFLISNIFLRFRIFLTSIDN